MPNLRHAWFGKPAEKELETQPLTDSTANHISELQGRLRFFNLKKLGQTQSVPLFLKQVHGTDVITVNQNFLDTYHPHHPPAGDALVTHMPGVLLAIATADCGPLLWCDPEKNLIAASHVGWRGAAGGIIENTFQTLARLGATVQNLRVCLGPTIHGKNYPVQDDFLKKFPAREQTCEFFKEIHNQLYFDLPTYIQKKIDALGIKKFLYTGQNTYQACYFSYRFHQQKGTPLPERNESYIVWNETTLI